MNPLNSVRGAITTGFVHRLARSCSLIAADRRSTSSGSRAGCTSSPASCGSACSTTSTSCRSPALGVAAADKGGPGGAGITKYVAPRALFWFRWARSPPGSRAPGICSALGQLRRRVHARRGYRPVQLLPARDRHRRVAGHDHAVQRLGADLAEPEEDPRHRAGDRRGEGQGAQDRDAGLAHRTSCCRSRCCCAWAPRRTACRSERDSAHASQELRADAGSLALSRCSPRPLPARI